MKPSPRFAPSSLLAAAALALGVAAPLPAAVDPSLLAGLEARAIGPATMSGRVASIAADPSDPNRVYVGAASGGVWKSVNGGLNWEPVFDDQPVASIGAVALDPSNPEVVWVGTGEGNPRNSVSVGNGIYRSPDGGRTWRHLGLEETRHIHRVVVHPRDPDTVWVAALGQVWGENPERGVFKTTDGGRTWRKVLYANPRTGAADLVMDPRNPRKLFAAMWDFRRWPWAFRSGGPGSGVFVSDDGGETWKRLTEDDGFPKGHLGRIGLAIAPSDPSVVYALVEAERDALLRSQDGGRTWKTVNREPDVSPRSFYYADLRVDPQNPNRVYRLASTLDVSDDGGRSFETAAPFRTVHPDHHAMWIHPADGRLIYEGNDGGVVVSRDRGETWHYVANLPLAQFYHVRVDDQLPFNVYGGLQDNGSWKGPSDVWENGGIRNHHWQEVGFGDGFDTAPDPRDPMRGWAMSQEGYLVRWDLRTGERKDVRPAPPAGEELRFNWNAALALDPFEPGTIYYGSQFVHKSTDGGDTWTPISPDLTTDRAEWQKQAESGGLTPDVTGAENFTTLVALAPSPLQPGVLWAGSDDGVLHVTRDGGATWQRVDGNLRGVPANTWVPHVHPSPQDAGTAFAVFDNHRRGDLTPYVQKTTDFGRTWTSLATPDLSGYALSIVQDPVDPDLLFLGTEFGLWLSLDGGKGWRKWTHGVPTASVMDLAIHPRDHALVVATHGRGLYVIDDLRPLRGLTEEAQREPLRLLSAADGVQYRVAQTGSSRFPGNGEFTGEGRPYGALVTFSLNVPGLPHPDDEEERRRKEEARSGKEAPTVAALEALEATAEAEGKPEGSETAGEPAGEPEREGRGRDRGPQAKIEILDAGGEVIRTFEVDARLGVNRAAWDLRRDEFKRPPTEEESEWWRPRGPEVLPGAYTVRVSYGGHSAEAPVRVLPDPRIERPEAARRANAEAQMRAGALQEAMTAAVVRLLETRADVKTVLGKLDREKKDRKAEEESGPVRDLRDAARDLQKGLDRLERRLRVPEDTKGIVAETDLESDIRYAARSLSSSWDAPTPAQLVYLDNAEQELRAVLADLDRFYAEQVGPFRQKVQDAGIGLLPEWQPVRIGE
jgi:photosystem II stability/assembly factor-like uncharacterized protein